MSNATQSVWPTTQTDLRGSGPRDPSFGTRVSCWGVRGGAAPLPPLHRESRGYASGAERAKRVEAERGVQRHPDTQNTKHIVRPACRAPWPRENARAPLARSGPARPACGAPWARENARFTLARSGAPRPACGAPWPRENARAPLARSGPARPACRPPWPRENARFTFARSGPPRPACGAPSPRENARAPTRAFRSRAPRQ
jgi:hypothetical protein